MNILFLNHSIHNCGVYQYGLRVSDILKNSKKINYEYKEISNEEEYKQVLENFNGIAIIYNYHQSTMPWLNYNNIQKYIKNIGIIHESDGFFFDVKLTLDELPRPLYFGNSETISNEFINYSEGKDVPIFGSFGFGFDNKGFYKIVEMINEQYEKAIIKLVIPNAHFDPDGGFTFIKTVKKCYEKITKKGIKLIISNDFLTNDDIALFLKSNDMNIFLYDKMEGRGISSVLDYAIAACKPIGISDSHMFRHIYSDEVCLYKVSIKECMKNSVDYFSKFLDEYSHEKFVNFFDNMFNIKSYSQAYQDLFVLYALDFKKNGSFVEIGSNHPIIHNNTHLLVNEFNWSGFMVEYDNQFTKMYEEMRPSCIYEIQDARNVDYRKVLDDNNFPLNIDYLQIDLDVNDRSTLDVLEKLNNTVFDKYKFATITFEHDIYTGNYFDTREKSRKIFKDNGYVLLFSDVNVFWEGKMCPFEDWYVHKDLVKFDTSKTKENLYFKDIIDYIYKK